MVYSDGASVFRSDSQLMAPIFQVLQLCFFCQFFVFFAKTSGHIADHPALRRQTTKRPEPEAVAGGVRQRRQSRLDMAVAQYEPPQSAAVDFMVLEQRREALDGVGALDRIRKPV